VSAGSEADHLVGIAQVGLALKILTFKATQIDQHLLWGGLAGEW
jgi:hypothetical protein